jgi:hypothetical protein
VSGYQCGARARVRARNEGDARMRAGRRAEGGGCDKGDIGRREGIGVRAEDETQTNEYRRKTNENRINDWVERYLCIKTTINYLRARLILLLMLLK